MKPSAPLGYVYQHQVLPRNYFLQTGQQDSVGLGLKLDERYHGLELPSNSRWV